MIGLSPEVLAFERKLSPAPINPFKAARQELKLTMYELSKLTGVSKQAIIRLEQGTFVEPLEAVAQYFSDQGFAFLGMRDEYYDFQTKMRERHHRMFGDIPKSKDPYLENMVHPFRELRGIFGPTYVAKALCISQASIEHFENRPAHQTIVPQAIQDVLNQIGYSREEIEDLNWNYRLYRRFKLNGNG